MDMEIDPSSFPAPPLPPPTRKRRAHSPPAAANDTTGPTTTTGQQTPAPAPAPAPRKARTTTSDLDALALIPQHEAWQLDLRAILEADADADAPQPQPQPQPQPRLTVLCVRGSSLTTHQQLLRSALPDLHALSPDLHCAVLSPSPSPSSPSQPSGLSVPANHPLCAASDSTAAIQIPTIHPSSPSRAFTALGLLHPLGGGRAPLDALVLVDRRGRRRLVLPFGWGAGRHVMDRGGGWVVRRRMEQVLLEAVAACEREWRAGEGEE